MKRDISGSRIKELRISKGMSADELGRLIGKNRATIYRYEDGSIDTIPIGTVKRLAEIFEVSPAYLIGYTDDPQPSKAQVAFNNAVESLTKAVLISVDPIIDEIIEKVKNLPDSEKEDALDYLDYLSEKSRRGKNRSDHPESVG